ncbi:Zinc finger protein 436 [Channa argus]|uniref:Zinc finger protein 436 n=1 Tax=Channa argus TaxID=215402 RepID=A0A6G1QS88_CHAAH|nr:Zinc finger protein 436 [Channa argus]
MEVRGSTEKISGLPLSALRLVVPPLQLLSAAMWQLAKQKDVMKYEKLQEFVFMVTEVVPGLINGRQRAQLILGLRARLILELCKGSARGYIDAQVIQSYLDKLPLTSPNTDEVFPVEYGPQYDAALHLLLWELLSKLEKLLPVPDLKQVFIQTFQLDLPLLTFYLEHGQSSTIGNCIMSALSIPPSQKTNTSAGLDSVHSYANILNPVTFVGADQYSVVAIYTEVEVGASEVDEEMMESTEVQVQTDFYEEEIVAVSTESTGSEEALNLSAEGPSEAVGVAKALETLTKTFALRKESLDQDALTGKTNESSLSDEFSLGNAVVEKESAEVHETTDKSHDTSEHSFEEVKDNFQNGGIESNITSSNYKSFPANNEMTDGPSEVSFSETQQCFDSANIRRSSRLQMRTSPRNKADVSVSPNVIAVKGINKGDSDEMTSIIFTCSQCPFHSSDENSPPHFHMQSVRTDAYRSLHGAKFTPSPSSSDEIFTSIKLFPRGNAEHGKAEKPDNQGKVNVSQVQGKQKSLTCETCGKMFTRTSDVRRHQLTHTGERPFHCSQCDRTFQHSWDLAKHESKHHGVAISFSCQLCRSSFANLRALTVHHKKSHSQESQLPQICSICSQSFTTSYELLEHRKSHVTSKRYICQQCGEGFDSLFARSQHRQMHQVKRQFKCPHCDKTYTRRSDVKRHLSTHTGERPYQCNQCNKREAQLHERIHTGERPYSCNTCELKFKSSSELARHKRSHSGLKPLKPYCGPCMKTFTSKAKLKKHMETHSGGEEAAQSVDSMQPEKSSLNE